MVTIFSPPNRGPPAGPRFISEGNKFGELFKAVGTAVVVFVDEPV